MIRQAISCDICGAEKRQTNHWFIACEQGGELRVSGWNARTRLRAGSKHLCGQACLHKLADDFMERIISNRGQTVVQKETASAAAMADTSLLAPHACDEFESSVHRIPAPIVPHTPPRPAATLVPMPERMPNKLPSTSPPEPLRYASRSWHAEAWQRECERTMQPDGQREGTPPRRISRA